MEPEWKALLDMMAIPAMERGRSRVSESLLAFVAKVVKRIERGPGDDTHNGTLRSSQVIALAIETWKLLNPQAMEWEAL